MMAICQTGSALTLQKWQWDDRVGFRPVGDPTPAVNMHIARLALGSTGWRPVPISDEQIHRPPRRHTDWRVLETWT